MSSNHNFDAANDIEKGHGPTLSIDASMSVGSPVQHASNDPLSPTFGATFSPSVSPLGLSDPSELSMQNISSLNLGSPHGAATPSIHALVSSAAIPSMSLDSSPATTAPATPPSADLPAAPKPAVIHNEPSPTATLPVAPLSTAVSEEKDKSNEKKEVFYPAVEKHAGEMRNEIFGRILYLVANTLLAKWTPLCVRLATTSTLQHLGGIHSGCALSGTGWLVYHVVWLCVHASKQHQAVIATGIVTNIAIIISVLSAFPWVRNNRHNLFERHHRFVGWTGLIFTWIFVMLGNGYDDVNGVWDWQGRQIVKTQDIYFVICMTILIALPWIFTRKVAVDVEIPSSKVAVLRFERGMQQGLLGRISRTSILEYHAFGIISEGKNAKYHYMVCGVQGDFTRGLVENPPKSIWTREIKFAGVSNTSTLYRRGIRIATGTGIGAALSTCLQSKDWFLIWIGSDQEKTFGKTIAGLIEGGIEPERRILWDTKKLKRPNTMKLLKDTFDSWGAEVVFITSNLGGNTEMMQGCKMLGIPAFGTLWDF
ncbi:hypothetical protein FRB90_006302 [Tulasnella sp. 427]|nr:hypothetical protein FRB90_006302 [Tulasnella sp. 427]